MKIFICARWKTLARLCVEKIFRKIILAALKAREAKCLSTSEKYISVMCRCAREKKYRNTRLVARKFEREDGSLAWDWFYYLPLKNIHKVKQHSKQSRINLMSRLAGILSWNRIGCISISVACSIHSMFKQTARKCVWSWILSRIFSFLSTLLVIASER